MDSNNTVILVDPEEQDTIARAIRTWLNTCPSKPGKIGYEYLSTLGIAMTTVQNACYTKRFVDGSYEAKYVCRLVYRDTCDNDDERLKMDETLNKIGRWAITSTFPVIASNIHIRKITRNVSALYGRYDDGAEDHTIELTITYEVNV